MNVLDPLVDRGPFSAAEDADLLNKVAALSLTGSVGGATTQMGKGLWSEIAATMPGRTDNQIWRRWKQLSG